jgi:hypothetical protein
VQFLNSEVHTQAGDVIQVHLKGTAANVQVMAEPNFQNYRSGRPFRYVGGHAKRSPVNIQAPGTGRWHVVVDLGGYAGSVNASVNVIRG